ncbi:RNA methyltransferase [Candidatus Dependentiae bacterium]|nr:RNA methyltransferase [Candidatus Dependentiae bacterium]
MTTKQTQPQEIVYGIHPIIELLKAKRRKIITLYTTRPEPKQWPQIKKLLPERPITIQYVDRTKLAKIAGTTEHQSVVALVSPYQYRTKPFEPSHNPLVVLLDGIQDTRNLGGILRSAYCTGFNGVIIPVKNSAPLTASTHKAAAGLAEHLQIYQAASAKQAVMQLSQAGYTIYLTTITGGKSALAVTFQRPTCLVIGSEETGISKELLTSGSKITLPQQRPDISYNASVAAGIFMFLASQQGN